MFYANPTFGKATKDVPNIVGATNPAQALHDWIQTPAKIVDKSPKSHSFLRQDA